MRKQLKLFRSFLLLDNKTKVVIYRIAFLFFKASYIVRFVKLKRYSHWFSTSESDFKVDLTPHKESILLIRRTLKRLPGRHTCLKECIVVHLYLRGKGIHLPIRLGVNTEKGMKAHAWYGPIESKGFNQLLSCNEE